MAVRELLSSSQREALEAVPLDRAGLIEHYVLSDQDLSLIRRRRGAQNRLGLAVQLALLRYPGRALLPGETPPPTELLTFVARQLGLSAGVWASYAGRDETRREHQVDYSSCRSRASSRTVASGSQGCGSLDTATTGERKESPSAPDAVRESSHSSPTSTGPLR